MLQIFDLRDTLRKYTFPQRDRSCRFPAKQAIRRQYRFGVCYHIQYFVEIKQIQPNITEIL